MASDLDTAQAVLEQRLVATLPSIAVAWPNVVFIPTNGSPWIRPTVVWGQGEELTMRPTQRNRVRGAFLVQVFVPLEQGGGEATRLIDTIRDGFNRDELSGVRCGTPSGPRPIAEAGPWYGLIVSIPFWIEETVT